MPGGKKAEERAAFVRGRRGKRMKRNVSADSIEISIYGSYLERSSREFSGTYLWEDADGIARLQYVVFGKKISCL